MNKLRSIKSIYNRIKLDLNYLVKSAFQLTTSAIAAIQIISFLCNFDTLFSSNVGFLKRLLISILITTSIWAIMLMLKCICIFNQKRVIVIDADNGHHVYVEYGDLFQDTEESRNIVITANRCFDTIVDNDLISETTIHGMAVKKICTNGYTPAMLNEALQNDLSLNRQIKPTHTLSREEKRKGNLNRYPAGSIAEFKKSQTNTTYFFVGLSAFNRDLHPETSDVEYSITIQALIEYCNSRSQRFPVYMPIIGTHGRSNKKSERELLEYLVSSLRFNKHLINTDIHIVVYTGRRESVSIYNL